MWRHMGGSVNGPVRPFTGPGEHATQRHQSKPAQRTAGPLDDADELVLANAFANETPRHA